MKAMLALFAITLSVAGNAAHVLSTSYQATTDEILVKIRYGGCKLETFTPVYGPCLETYPMQTTITIQDQQDRCKAIMTATLRVAAPAGCKPAFVTVRTASAPRTASTVFVPAASENE